MKIDKYAFVFLVCLGLYIDALSVSMGFSFVFCIWTYLKNKFLGLFETFEFFELWYFVLYYNGPKWSSPIPVPSVSKSLLPVLILEKHIFYDFLWFSWKKSPKYPARELTKGSRKIYQKIIYWTYIILIAFYIVQKYLS